MSRDSTTASQQLRAFYASCGVVITANATPSASVAAQPNFRQGSAGIAPAAGCGTEGIRAAAQATANLECEIGSTEYLPQLIGFKEAVQRGIKVNLPPPSQPPHPPNQKTGALHNYNE